MLHAVNKYSLAQKPTQLGPRAPHCWGF